MIDILIDKFNNKKRTKNGEVVSSLSNVKEFKILKKSLSHFTTTKYGIGLYRVYFGDIDRNFINNYTLFIQKREKPMGNNGGLPKKLKKLRAVCRFDDDENIPNVDVKIFDEFSQYMEFKNFESKAISKDIIGKIEKLDRKIFTKKQSFCIDMFLFSYYVGGMSNVDVITLKWISVENGSVDYERRKIPKHVNCMMIDKANAIIEKNEGEGYSDYVFPILSSKHVTGKSERKIESIAFPIQLIKR